MQVPPRYIDQYVEKMPNMNTFMVNIVHNTDRKEVRTQSEGQPPTAQMEETTINGGCGRQKNYPTSPPLLGQTNNPRSPPPKQNPNHPPQYGWNMRNNGSQGGSGRQIYFPTDSSRKGRNTDQDDGYEMVDDDNSDPYYY